MLLSRQPWMDVNTTHLTGTAGGQRERRGVWRMTLPTLPSSCRSWRLLLTGPPRPPLQRQWPTGSCGRPVFLALTCTSVPQLPRIPYNQCRRTGGWSEQKSSLNGSPAALPNDHGASNLHQRWMHLTPSARRGPGPDGPELTVRGNTDGKPPAGSRPGPSNHSTVVQKAAVDWCWLVWCNGLPFRESWRFRLQKSESKIFSTFLINGMREKTNMTNIENQRESITTDPTDITSFCKWLLRTNYAHKFYRLD